MIGPDLRVRVGSLHLENPVLCASGTFGYGIEAPLAASRLGGIVTKTITLEPRSGNRPPRIAETPAGLLNSIGLQNVGVDRFLTEKLPPLRHSGRPLIVSVGGRTAEEFRQVVELLDHAEGIAAYELNISCPNVEEGGLEFSQVPSAAAAVTERARKTTERPLWVKLSPNVTSIGELARACQQAGADAVTAVNTFVGMAVDVQQRRPRLSRPTGGLSGPAIRPLALARVHEVVQSVSIPVIGVGGIRSAADALEFLLVGARAVQVGTSHFLRPDQGAEILEGIRDFLDRSGIASIEEFIGTLRGSEE